MKKILAITFLCCIAMYHTAHSKTTNTLDIGGMVFLGTNTIATHLTYKLWLIEFDSTTNILSAVDSVEITGTPHYMFYNVTTTKLYRVKAAIINDTTGAGFVPTYHDSSVRWDSATAFYWTNGYDSLHRHVHMRAGTPTSGPGFIGGNVANGANKGTSGGYGGLQVMLFDATTNKFIKHVTTDANGDFSFKDLPYGSYKVHPEELGFNTQNWTISLTSSTPALNNIYFERSLKNKTLKQISVGIEDVPAARQFSVYPNPVRNTLTLKLKDKGDAYVNICDMGGRSVYTATLKVANGIASAGLQLAGGVYLLSVTQNGTTTSQKLEIE